MIPSLQTDTPGDETGYKFHVMLSYDRQQAPNTWFDLFFREELSKWLQQELNGEQPILFYNQDGIRKRWGTEMEDIVRRSPCLVSIISPSYWRSPECLAEWTSFREREKVENIKLIAGILFHGGSSFPAAWQDRWIVDFREYALTYRGYRNSEGYGDFEREVKTFAHELASFIECAPRYEPTWPVISPSHVKPVTTARIRIPQPFL
jgi:hypothetical protein